MSKYVDKQPSYHGKVLTRNCQPHYSKSFSRSSTRFNQHVLENSRPKDSPSDGRYRDSPVLPLLSSDPISTMLLLWLPLADFDQPGVLQAILMYTYRFAIVKFTLSALQTLGSSEKRRSVCQSTSSKLAPLLAVVYKAFEEHDGAMFYRSDCEVAEVELLKNNVSHGDESLVDMRLRDIEYTQAQEENSPRSYLETTHDVTVPTNHQSDDQQVEHHITTLCLQFLRIAAFLKHQLYGIKLPTITDPTDECAALEAFLGLSLNYSVSKAETVTSMSERLPSVLQQWVPPHLSFTLTAKRASSVLIRRDLHASPSLIELPKVYEFLFR